MTIGNCPKEFCETYLYVSADVCAKIANTQVFLKIPHLGCAYL